MYDAEQPIDKIDDAMKNAMTIIIARRRAPVHVKSVVLMRMYIAKISCTRLDSKIHFHVQRKNIGKRAKRCTSKKI